MVKQPAPLEVAKTCIATHFPNCKAAIFAGSASRGEHKAHSDLDIVIIDDALSGAYRESRYEFGWRVELFIHTSESLRQYFQSDRARGRPTMPNMCATGIVLKDDGTTAILQEEAKALLMEGPAPLTFEAIQSSRYFITDLLEDFIDADRHDEALITMMTLSLQVAEFVLRANKRWSGRGKGLIRELRKFDQLLCDSYIQAIETYTQTQNKQPFIRVVDCILEPYGGRLFEGFSLGKPKIEQ